jgi:PAS domain S-box-containing protein
MTAVQSHNQLSEVLRVAWWRSAPAVLRYALAVALVVVALAVKELFDFVADQDQSPFLFLFFPVFVAAVLGGLGPAIVAGVGASVLTQVVYGPAEPGMDFSWEEAVRVVIFSFEAVAIGLIVEAYFRRDEALRQGQAVISQAFHANPAAISITRARDRRILDANQAFLDVLGYERHEVVGKLIDDVGIWPSPEERERFASAVSASPRPRDMEQKVVTKSGEVKDVLGSAEVVQIGDEPCVLALFVDVSARKRAENERNQLIGELQEQRKRIDEMVRDVPGVVWEAWGQPDAETQRIEFVSDYVESMLGYSKEEWLATPNFWLTLVHPDDREKAAADAARIFADRKGGTNEFRWVAKDGRVFWVEAQSTVICDESGDPVGMRGVTMDITARRRAEEAVRESERSNRELVEGLGVAVYTTDADGRITHFNDEAAALWGRSPEIGQDMWCGSWRLYWPDGRPMRHDECPMAVTLKENRPVRGAEAIAERPDGGRVTFVPYPTPLRNAEGKLVGAVNVLVDITERKKTEEALRESEDRLAALIKQSAVGVVHYDAAGKFLLVNRAFCDMVGRTESELLNGMGTADITHPDDQEQTIELFGALVAGGPDYEIEKRYLRPDGKEVWVNKSVAGVRTASGELRHIVAFVLDITERKDTEHLLEFQLALVAAQSEAAIEGMLASTPQGEILSYNKRFLELWGLSEKDVEGADEQTVRRHIGTRLENVDDVQAAIAGLEERQETKLNVELRLKDGRTFDAYSAPLHSPTGKTFGRVWFVRDMSERQRIEDELRRASEAKDEFLGLMSHELRTPLSTIFGGARLLRTRQANLDEPTRDELLSDIEEESERLHRIVEDLLALARVQLGQQAAVEPVLAERLTQRVVEATKRRHPTREIELTSSEDIEVVAADPTYVEQVVRNLLANALKYSPPEEPIEVRVEKNGSGEVKVRVLDRGPGIPADETEQIFDRFYRANATAKTARGLGMGLTVSKRLVEALSGRIWAEPRDGGGLEVGFTLPVYQEARDDHNGRSSTNSRHTARISG